MSSSWCYRCSSFVTISGAAGDAVLVCPDCGQQRWSSTIVEYNVDENLQAVVTLPTVEVCVVCIEELDSGAELRETPCKHTYHSHCLGSSLRNIVRVQYAGTSCGGMPAGGDADTSGFLQGNGRSENKSQRKNATPSAGRSDAGKSDGCLQGDGRSEKKRQRKR